MASKYLIYGLVDPRTQEIRYVGKSCSGLNRPKVHGCRCRVAKDRTHKGRWIAGLQAKGLTFSVVVLEECQHPEDLFAAERRWIAHGRAQGWRLTNLTDGGEGAIGMRHSAETRAKIGQKSRAKSPESWARTFAAVRNPTPETLAKMSASHRGAVLTDGHKEKLRLAITGKKRSPETRARMKQAQIKRRARERACHASQP